MIDEDKLLQENEGDMVAVKLESDHEEEEEEDDQKKTGDKAAMDTSDNKEGEGEKKEGEKADEDEKTLLTEMVRGPIRLSLVLIRDLSNHDLQQILHRCSKAILQIERRKGVFTLWFEPRRSIAALGILRKLAQLKLAGEDYRMECPKALASMIATEKIKLKYPDGKYGNKNKNLYVHDIPKDTTEEVLRGMFPNVASVQLPVDSEGEKMGIAILDYKSGKDANSDLAQNSQVLIGDATCEVSTYFPAPEEAEEQLKKSEKERKDKKRDNWNQNRQRNRGGGGGGGNRGYDRQGGYGNRGGNYSDNWNRGYMQQERTNQMLMNQMQSLASMVMGNQNRFGNQQSSMGGGYSGDMGYGGDMGGFGGGGGGFGNYQSGYLDDDYGTPNKRRRGGGNMGGGGRSGGNRW